MEINVQEAAAKLKEHFKIGASIAAIAYVIRSCNVKPKTKRSSASSSDMSGLTGHDLYEAMEDALQAAHDDFAADHQGF